MPYLRGTKQAAPSASFVSARESLGFRLSKRIKRLENQGRYTKPEKKEQQQYLQFTALANTFYFYDLTDISLGTLDSNRLGNAIRVTGVKLLCHANNPGVDMLLVKSVHGTTPGVGDFVPGRMTDVLSGSVDDHKIVSRLRSYSNDNQYVSRHVSFKYPLEVRWSDTSSLSVNKNRLTLVFNNATGASQACEYIATIYWVDA